jgi:Mlc titration factor MtfA (ptsG expression regulator)
MPELQWLRKLLHLTKPQIPDDLWQTCIARLPFLRRLSGNDLQRLKKMSEELLHTKTITGAGGLEITDEMAVMIVAQAALVVLNLTLDLYQDMPGIVVYPSAFVVKNQQRDGAGIIHEWREPLAGQAMSAGGSIVLSWEDVASNADFWSRRNVVVHEFAHKIDMERGHPNGCPPFLVGYHDGMKVNIWQRVFNAAYHDFTRRVHSFAHWQTTSADNEGLGADDFMHHLHAQAQRPLPLDPYAAKNPAEFFAVASEVFFVAPTQLIADYPDVYRLLSQYYRQETIAFPAKPQD